MAQSAALEAGIAGVLVGELHKQGVQFKSLTDAIGTASGRFFFHVMASLAERNGKLTIERTRAGLEVARQLGRTGGRKRIAQGHRSAMKSLGEGVLEYKIDFRPGYGIYFGKDGDRLVILVGGGTKKRQSKDIKAAKEASKDYKRRKRHRDAANGTEIKTCH